MVIIQLIQHNSKEYQRMLALREQVLLRPIGIPPSFIHQEKEKDDFLIAAFNGDEMIGCCVLTPIDDLSLQLRQMAVKDNFQGKGIGRDIIRFAEKISIENGFKVLMMHARDAAIPFYKKNGYSVVGEAFSEVGIVHFKMQKGLS